MTDSQPHRQDYTGTGADEELVFDDFAPVDAQPASIEDTTSDDIPADAPENPTPRRAPRRGRKSVEADIAPIASAEAAPAAPAEEPAGGTPAPFPPRETQPAGSTQSRLLLAIVALAMLTTTVSLGGLIAVSRTLAHAGVAREEAEAERAALARVPLLVQHLDDASAKLDAASARLAAASPAGPPASVADVRREIDLLKIALATRQPQGLGTLNSMTRDGFSEVVTKLDRIQARVGGSAKPVRQDQDAN